MKDLELNKIAASILVAGLIGMIAGKVADGLYQPEMHPEKRGFEAAVAETSSAGAAPAAPVEIKIGQLMANANAEAGKDVIKKCAACHDVAKGGPNKVGPNLWGIVGAKVAHLDNFTYSPAMAAAGGTWDYKHLFDFLTNPKAVIPGTKMAFAGLRKPEDVANAIAYLREQGDSKPALPPVEP